MFEFKVIAQSKETRARAGVIQTDHGVIETPVFMPVGTLGSVKSLSPEELAAAASENKTVIHNTANIVNSDNQHKQKRKIPGSRATRKNKIK